MAVPEIIKNSRTNIHSFCNYLEIFENGYQKYWSASIKEAHYLNKKFCDTDFNNFRIIFVVIYKKHELIIGFIF